jgi:crotonobetainyl-CoA:carnitine CoA-transferase CaiB-like acyl-CoA transferase
MSYDAPFAGLKVVDLSQGIAGPYAAMLLAQYGADVIKVEPPDGDWSRTLGQRYGDHTAFSIAGNLGKRSIALDLKHPQGRTILERLARRADVFIEGFRPGVAARLGVAYADVAALNPRVVYLSISGFGQSGPESARPAMDPVLQAFTGLISVNRGFDGVPHRVAAIPVDMTTALYSFQALAVALYARRRESQGCYIDASLMQSAAALQSVHLMAHYLEGGRMRPGLTPSGTFPASDGWIQLTIHQDSDFASLCAALEIPDVRDDPRFATDALRYENVAVLTPLLNAAFARRPTRELGERLRAAGIMHERVNDYLDFLRHPHVEATSAIAWIEQPGVGKVPIPNVPGLPPLVSGSRRARAPSLDEHRAEILAEIGQLSVP